MKRRNLIFSVLALFPLNLLAKVQSLISLRPGDVIFLPRNVQHAFVQLTEKGKMVVSYLPAGKMEAFFKVTNEWTSPPTKDEIEKVFAEHDMKVVGPPIKFE